MQIYENVRGPDAYMCMITRTAVLYHYGNDNERMSVVQIL
jgi:hypothetical protein